MSNPIWIGHEDDPREEEEHDVSGLEQLRPGDIGFGNIGGAAGALVWLGQQIVDATTPEESRYKHVFVVVEGGTVGAMPDGPAPRIVQAMPSGAEEIRIGVEHWRSDTVYIRPRYNPYIPGSATVAQNARARVGTPYSFLDYVAIAGLHVGIKNGL